MGFGTLFIGYFLLLNVTYFGYTDLISGLIMLMGLYKLSGINKDFKLAFYSASVFSLFGAAELVVSVISIFMPTFKEGEALLYITPIRYVILVFLSAFIMKGIYEVAKEVGLKQLAQKAKYYFYISSVAFSVAAIFDLPFFGFIPGKALAIISVLLLLALFIIIAIELSIIYKAYMRICMPGEENGRGAKPSRFGFVNRMREERTAREREEYEYRAKRLSEKAKKRRRK